VNPVDIKTRDGKLKTLLKYRFPLVLGNDLSGVVSDVGSRVTRFKKGNALACSESGRATGKVVIKVV
jgi:alcohol dehydrogenase